MRFTTTIALLFTSLVLYLGVSQATFMGNTLGDMNMVVINDTVWTPKAFDLKEKSYATPPPPSPAEHGVAEEHLVIDSMIMEYIILNEPNMEVVSQKIRQIAIQAMVDRGFDNFVTRPWQTANGIITYDTGTLEYTMSGKILDNDPLDNIVKHSLEGYYTAFDQLQVYHEFAAFPTVSINMQELMNLENVYLFRDDDDLHALGYTIVSYRSRINEDKDYRRHNISTAFDNMGNIIVLNPKQDFNVMQELHYSPYKDDGKKPFERGYAIFGSVERLVYGGGLCGVATAVTQGILTNVGIEVLEKKAHSKWYRDLYTAYVNGELVDEPGLDATVYSNEINVRFRNSRDYPVILVMNYDGSVGGEEQVFTLANPSDQGHFEFVKSYRSKGKKCYERNINGNTQTNCYGKVVMN